jgi:outer membrane protein
MNLSVRLTRSFATYLLAMFFLIAGPATSSAEALLKGATVLSIEDAVLMALEHNRALHVQRFEPEIRQTFIDQERGLFDPLLSGEIIVGRQRFDQPGLIDPRRDMTDGAEFSISGFLPTGTRLEADVSTQRFERGEQDKIHETRLGMTVTQALLQGRGIAVNMAGIRQASLDLQMSEYELTGFAQSLVAQVEITYWEYVLALQQVEIVLKSLDLAEQQLRETSQRVRVGGIAETEIAAANAEVALRKEALINARSRVDMLTIQLLRLVAPGGLASGFRDIVPITLPEAPPVPLENISDHIGVAMQMRPELLQAGLMIKRGDLEIVRTKNGLLPRMDLFVRLGKTGYADSFSGSAKDIDGDSYDTYAGIRVSRSISRDDVGARHRRALLTRQQQEMSLENLRDLVREDVELAYIEVMRTLQQVNATEITRRFQEEKLRAETAKFKVGRSTALLVAQAQRDLLESQVSEVAALTNYLKARINFYLMEGSLLKRRGLEI